MKNKNINLLFQTIKKPWWLVENPSKISQRILKKYTDFCCDNLPKPIRKRILFISDKINLAFIRIIFLFSQIYITMYLVKGREKHSGVDLSILLITNKEEFPYLSKIMFSESPQIERIERVFLWNIRKKLKKISPEIDSLFIRSDRFYSHYFEKQGFTIIPEWVTTTMDITKPIEDIYKKFSKSGKEDIRKVKKYNYSYELTEDLEKLKLFYYKMYLPYTSDRHGKSAICVNFHAIRHLFERDNKLMMIKYNDEYVFGSLFYVKRDKAIATYTGLMEGKDDCLKRSVSAASYYFLIQWAKENGINYLDFGKCRSFLNDGVFRYKRKWGTSIRKTDSNSPGVIAFKTCKSSEGNESFLLNNPFICLENNQLKVRIYKQKNQIISEELPNLLSIEVINDSSKSVVGSSKDLNY